VAAEYDLARPDYPAGVYDALGPLAGALVLDGGAGTGIATRQLAARGARVIAFDRGRVVLLRARVHTPDQPVVVADGGCLPFRDASVDLICFAQAWHWIDERTRDVEAHRVLRASGRWAGWWSHARADDDAWFDRYWSIVESACPGVDRRQRDIDWGAGVARSGRFDVGDRLSVPWTREIAVDDWLIDLRSHSYIAALPPATREHLVAEVRTVLDRAFPTGAMIVPYETWLWIGHKR